MKKILFVLVTISSLTIAFAKDRHPIFATLDSSLGKEITYFSENNFFESKMEEAKVRKLFSELSASLVFIENIKLAKTSPLFREFFKKGALDFLSENIKEFEWDSLLGDPLAPIAMASGPDQSPSINVGFNYLKSHFSAVEKASILIHEARHNQSVKFDHLDCPLNFPYSSSSGVPLAGEAACEKNYNGSYGVQIIFLKNISKFCTNCTTQVKQTANKLAVDYLNRIINKSAQEKLLKD